MEEYYMDCVDLIEKLNEINKCKKEAIAFIKQNIGIINEIIYNSFDPGEFLREKNNANPFQMISQKAVVWNFLGNMKNIFFIKNNIWFNIACENRSIYIGFLPNVQKIESADDDTVIEYIEFIISNKNTISNRMDLKIKKLQTTPEQMNDFINDFQDKINTNG